MPYRTTRTRVRRSSRTGIPHLSSGVQRMVRLEKAGIDVIPRLISYTLYSANAKAAVNSFAYTAGAEKDAKLALSPIKLFYVDVTNNMAVYKTQFKEWRLKQCKVHVMLEYYETTANWTNCMPLSLNYAWIRNGDYSYGTPQVVATTVISPDCKQKVWTPSEAKPEFWTSITAGTTGGEGNWLNTAVAPATAPNNGMYFQPELKFNTCTYNSGVDTELLIYSYEIEFVVEFRGSLQ